MHRIVGQIAALQQLTGPAFGIIVDADQTGSAVPKARMVEQCEVAKAELEGRVADEGAKLGQVPAGPCRFSEAIAEPPHCVRHMTMNALPLPAKPVSLLTPRYKILVK